MLVSAGLIGLFSLVLVGVYWDTFALMFENMTAMAEGREIASEMRGPDDLLAYVEAHPEHVSLVAFDVDERDVGIFYGEDSLRPVVGLPSLLVLAEYARQVEAGALDPEARVPLGELHRHVLPGTDGGQHRRARAALVAAGAVDADSTVALRDVADAMVRWSDNAAADLLLGRLGPGALDALLAREGRLPIEPPLPQSGLYLSWNNHASATPPEARLRAIQALAEPAYAEEVNTLAVAYREDPGFRQREVDRLEQQGTDLSLRQQRALAHATFPQGTARGYAHLVARALQDSLVSPAVSRHVLSVLDRPVPDSVGVNLDVIGSQGGSFPGLISFVGYARRADAGGPRVVALLMDEVPMSVFYHLLQTGIDKGLVVQLLGDDAFFERVRQRLAVASG